MRRCSTTSVARMMASTTSSSTMPDSEPPTASTTASTTAATRRSRATTWNARHTPAAMPNANRPRPPANMTRNAVCTWSSGCRAISSMAAAARMMPPTTGAWAAV